MAGIGITVWLLPIAVSIIAYASKFLLTKPLSAVPQTLAQLQIDSGSFHAVQEAAKTLMDRSTMLVSNSTGMFGISRISAGEREFLDEFARLLALLNALEAYVLLKEMREGFSFLYEWFAEQMLEIVTRTIERLVESGELTSKPDDQREVSRWTKHQRTLLRNEFGASGIDDLIDERMLVANQKNFLKLILFSLPVRGMI